MAFSPKNIFTSIIFLCQLIALSNNIETLAISKQNSNFSDLLFVSGNSSSFCLFVFFSKGNRKDDQTIFITYSNRFIFRLKIDLNEKKSSVSNSKENLDSIWKSQNLILNVDIKASI